MSRALIIAFALLTQIAAASEERLQYRLRSAVLMLEDGWVDGKATDKFHRAVEDMVGPGPLAEKARLADLQNRFVQIASRFGKPLRYGPISSRQIQTNVVVDYATITFHHGVAFMRVVGYKCVDGDTVATLLKISDDPAEIFPPELLLPEK